MFLHKYGIFYKMVRCLCAVLLVFISFPVASFASEVSNGSSGVNQTSNSSGYTYCSSDGDSAGTVSGVSSKSDDTQVSTFCIQSASDLGTSGGISSSDSFSSATYSGNSFLRTASLGGLASKCFDKLLYYTGKVIPWTSGKEAIYGFLGSALLCFGISTPAFETFVSETADNPAIVVFFEDQGLDVTEAAYVDIDIAYQEWLNGVSITDAISEWSEYAQKECTCIADTGYTLSGSAPTYEGTLYQEIQTGVIDAGWINSNSVFLQWLAQVIVGDSNVSSPTTSGSATIADLKTTSADYPINGVSLLYSGYPMSIPYSSSWNDSNWIATCDYHYDNGSVSKLLFYNDDRTDLTSKSVYIYEGDGKISDGVDAFFLTARSTAGSTSSFLFLGESYRPSLSWVNDYTWPTHSVTDLRFNANDTIFVYSGSLEGSNDTNGVRGSLVAFYQAGVWTESDGTVLSGGSSITWPTAVTVIGDNATYDSTGAITDFGTINAVGASSAASDASYQQNLDAADASTVASTTPVTSSSTTTAGNTVGNTVTNPTTPTDETEASNFKMPDLSDVFPFCIPFDLYAMFAVWVAAPVAPSFHLPLVVPVIGTFYLDVDLSPWDGVAAAFRVLLMALFGVGLAMITRDLIRG